MEQPKTPDFTDLLVEDLAKFYYSRKPLPFATWDDLSDFGKEEQRETARETVKWLDEQWNLISGREQ